MDKQQAREMTPCFGRTGAKHPMFGKKHTDEALRKISSAWHLTQPTYRSKPEIELEEFCKTLASVKHSVHIGRWNVDVKFDDVQLIVEMFGDWWHMNPQKYADSDVNVVTKKQASFVWERDARKLSELQEHGWTVEVVWESEWKKTKEACMKRIKDAYDRML